MPRPKKTTPTVATTEPDTNLNPDRAQVAAVAGLPLSAADLIRASLPRDTPPEEVIRVAHFYDELKAAGETMPTLTGKTFRSVEDLTLYLSQTDRSEVADLPHAPEPFTPDEDGEPLDAYAARLQAERNALRDYLRMSADPTVSPDVGGEYFRRMSKADQVLTNAFVERVCASEAKMVDPILAAKDERIALMDVERANHRKEVEMWMGAVQKVTAERDERAARIAELETWTVTQNYRRGIALDDIRCAILDTGHPLGDDSDPELTPLRLVREVLAKVAEPARPLTPHEIVHGYRAVASGQVKAAEWKGRRLVRLHGNPEPIAMYDHPEPPPGCMPSGFVAEVASGTTRIMSPPLKDEAEARAWCEARCGWTVVQ